MISLQTNVTSLMAQQNLNTDNAFQAKTIDQLTSGYRINSSGDDAAGLAIANGYRSNIAELTQGVSNANQGTSQLQIVDGGLNNISTILDRLKTLATQSASDTFTGSRATLNQEYASLLTEVDRQAANINLNSGGSFNTNLSVYIGGASNQSNASVSVDLSGASSAVDSKSLGLASTNVVGGGVGVGGNLQHIDAPGATFVKGVAGTDDQTFTFNVFSNGGSTAVTASVGASTNGSSESSVLASLNGQLNKYGINAGTDSNGALQFSGATAFTVKDNGSLAAGTSLLTNDDSSISGAAAYTKAAQTLTFANAAGVNNSTTSTVSLLATDSLAQAITKINAQSATTGISAQLNTAGTGVDFAGSGAFTVTGTATGALAGGGATITGAAGVIGSSSNTSNYTVEGAQFVNQTGAETLQFQTSSGAATVTLGAGDTLGSAISKINAQTASLGVFAVENANGNGISLQGANSFSVTDHTATNAKGFYGAGALAATDINATSAAPTASSTSNGTAAITAINNAIQALGLVQGKVGAGENKLAYATSLAQSQISSFSAAQSQIRDADVAAQAANLTKAQVLVQTSVAALAQANSAPQSILKLLQ